MSFAGFGIGCTCGSGTGALGFGADIQVLCDPGQYCGTFTDRTPDGIGVDVVITVNGGPFPLGTLSGASPAALAADLTTNDPFGGTWSINGTEICVVPAGGNQYNQVDLNWLTPATVDNITLTADAFTPFLQVCTIDENTGTVTVCNNFELDGVTPYVPQGVPQICLGSGGTALFTAQVELLGDYQPPFPDNIVVPFQRVKILENTTGNIAGVSDFDMAAVPYVPTGTVAPLHLLAEGGPVALCDDNGVFLSLVRRNPSTGTLVVTTKDVNGVLYIPVGTIHHCGEYDSEQEHLCDGATSFIRTYVKDSDGNTIATVDTDVDGAPYVTVGIVQACEPDPRIENDWELLCDDNGVFLRRIQRTIIGTVTFDDRDLTGAGYVATGTIHHCAQYDLLKQELCDVQVGGTVDGFIRFTIYDNSIQAGVANIDVDYTGAVYTPTGTVSKCTDNTLQWHVLCDDNGPFLRYGGINPSNGAIGSSDYLIDASATYAPVGPIHDCGQYDVETEILCDAGQFCGSFIDLTPDAIGVDVVITVDGTSFPLGTLTGASAAALAADITANDPTGAVWTISGTEICVTPPVPGGTAVYEEISFNWLTPGQLNVTTLNPANVVPFEQVKVFDAGVNPPVIIATAQFDLAGGPYVVGGSIVICTDLIKDTDTFGIVWCDYANPAFQQFVRWFETDGTGQVIRTWDTTDDGVTPYVQAGTGTYPDIGPCPGQNFEPNITPLCALDTTTGVTRSFLRHYQMLGFGFIIGQVDYELDGTTLFTVGAGEVVVQCENLFVEIQCMIDIQADGTTTPYVRQRVGYSTSAGSGAVLSDLVPDLSLGYVVTGVAQVQCESYDSRTTFTGGNRFNGVATLVAGVDFPGVVRTLTAKCVATSGGGGIVVTTPDDGTALPLPGTLIMRAGDIYTWGDGDSGGPTDLTNGATGSGLPLQFGLGNANDILELIWERP